MGDVSATLTLLADAVSTAERFVTVFVVVYSLLIFAYVITSWVRIPSSLSSVQRFLYDVCEPYLRLFRRVLPPLGPVDVSPIVAVAALYLLERLINQVLLERLR
ncbi:MAG TPA: YggT family protein [Gaiellaceae bacterium]|nr:YggT family protein [Gaiellaceae bacterium]